MLTVMIAENDPLMGDMLEESLVDAGYRVCGIARTVAEGVALGELHKPDLALLVLRLNHGTADIVRALKIVEEISALIATCASSS